MGSLGGHTRFLRDWPIFSLGQLAKISRTTVAFGCFEG